MPTSSNFPSGQRVFEIQCQSQQPSDDLFKIGLIMDEVLGFNAGIMMPYFINA
ncbi:hypothetical protein Golob_010190, partial [Gossypium lobatum]|nr:hypothetical protein [Gossypium lobatum]